MANEYTIYLDYESSTNAGLIILSPLKLSPLVPRIKRYSVPGRNGDVIISDGTFENRTATVQACMYVDGRGEYIKEKLANLNEWLFSYLGYRRLETADDPNHYLMARVSNGPEIAAKATKAATFTIKFDCKPQRFINDSYTYRFNGSGSFDSSSSFPSKPLIEVNHGNSGGTGIVGINGTDITFNLTRIANDSSSSIYFDTDTEQTYSVQGDGSVKEYSDVVSYSGEIVVEPGTNDVSSRGVSFVEITPRGWDL